MVNENNLEQELKHIFYNSQETTSTHQKNCYKLKKLYEENELDQFFQSFIHLLNHTLLVDFSQRNSYIEKIYELVSSFCFLLKSTDLKNNSNEETNEDDEDFQEHPFIDRLFLHLLEASQNLRDVVRFRACQLTNRILDRLAGTTISNDFCDNMKDSLRPRLYDTKNVIRLQGIFSLFRLQDSSDPNDEIIQSFISFTSDPNAKIRQLCVEKISVSKKVIPHIVLRTRDTDPNVRLAAYKRLSLLAKALKIVEKQEILKCAMTYNTPKVTEYVSKTLLDCWLDQYDKNILLLIKSLRLDADENDIEDTSKIVQFVLLNIFKTKTFNELSNILSLDNKKLVPLEHLNWETVIYWKVFVEYLADHDQLEDALDQVLPELQDLCLYIKKFLSLPLTTNSFPEFLQQQFITKNLFAIMKIYEFNDPSRKRLVNSLITVILEKVDLTCDTVKEIIDTLKLTIPNNVEQRCNFVGELISEILCPMDVEEAARIERERECELAKLSVKQMRLMADLETAIAEQRFMEADSLQKDLESTKSSLSELKNASTQPHHQQLKQKTDAPTLVKCLGIARAMLLSPQITTLLPSLKTLQKHLIEDLVGHENDTVKAIAMECYGLCCIIDKGSAEIGIQIFSTPILAYKAGEECDTQILIVCTKAVVDLLRIFGTDLIAEPDENSMSETRNEVHKEIFSGGTSLTDIIQGISDLMDDDKYELQEVSGQGLCKLVISKRIYSAALISKLILKWGSPCTDDQDSGKLKQFIGYSLQQIPLLSDSSEQLEGAVILTINTIIKAPKTSPLADINVDNIMKFMVALCKISPDEQQIFSNLALKVCLKMRQKPRSILNSPYSKLLLLIDVPYNALVVNDLLKLCDQIKDDVRERIIITNITKFVSLLTRKKMEHDGTKPDIITTKINEDSEEEENNSMFDTKRVVRNTLSTASFSSNTTVMSRSTVKTKSFNNNTTIMSGISRTTSSVSDNTIQDYVSDMEDNTTIMSVRSKGSVKSTSSNNNNTTVMSAISRTTSSINDNTIEDSVSGNTTIMSVRSKDTVKSSSSNNNNTTVMSAISRTKSSINDNTIKDSVSDMEDNTTIMSVRIKDTVKSTSSINLPDNTIKESVDLEDNTTVMRDASRNTGKTRSPINTYNTKQDSVSVIEDDCVFVSPSKIAKTSSLLLNNKKYRNNTESTYESSPENRFNFSENPGSVTITITSSSSSGDESVHSVEEDLFSDS